MPRSSTRFAIAAGLVALTRAPVARAGSRDLGEDDERKAFAAREAVISLDVGAAISSFSVDTSWWDAVKAPVQNGSATNAISLLEVRVDVNLLKVMGIGLGYFRADSSGAGVANGAPASLSQDGMLMAIDAYPIGNHRVQAVVGITELFAGSTWVTVFSGGVRVDLGRLKITPRISHTDFTVRDADYVTSSESWGWGASLLVSWSLTGTAP